MKREIKFRGKCINTGQWVYGMPAFDRDCTGIDKIEEPMKAGGICRLVDPKTVGQYTGVYEDSEVPQELFDKDIVEVEYKGHKHVCKVQYCGSGYILVADSFTDGFLWLSEVVDFDGNFCWAEGTKKIGNIYDNPDLLEGGYR